MNIYLGDVLIDEITSLGIKVEQRKMPIYGYADQLFTKVSKGTVLVQGTFTINFTKTGYLYTVLERFQRQREGHSGSNISPVIDQDNFVQGKRGNQLSDKQMGFLSRQNIQQIKDGVDNITSGKVNGRQVRPEEYIEYFQDISALNRFPPNTIGPQLSSTSLSDKVFEEFENKIWGNSRGELEQLDQRGDSNRWDNFTIFITWGDYNDPSNKNKTSKRIDNIHLIDQAQSVMINGEPVQEQYTFIARSFQ